MRLKVFRDGLSKIAGLECLLIALMQPVPIEGKIKETGKPLAIRQITIRNIAYSFDGRIFAVPNFVTAGSVAIFWVNEQGEIAPVPSRLSEKKFVRSSGLFYLQKAKETDPPMAFITLPELLSGYSVDFAGNGLTLAVAGGSTVNIYDGNNKWEKVKSLTIGQSVSRAVLSRDGAYAAAISDGKLFLFSAPDYKHIATIEPADDCRFGDAAFSNNGRFIAVFEYRFAMFDLRSRLRIYRSEDGGFERDLPYFPARPSSEPGIHLPLVSWAPDDTALAVTIHTSFTGKVYLIKSNDGTIIREFKGFCHCFSPDGTLFAAGGRVFSVRDWSVLGSVPHSTVACAFSPTERVIIVVTSDSIRRFRIEER